MPLALLLYSICCNKTCPAKQKLIVNQVDNLDFPTLLFFYFPPTFTVRRSYYNNHLCFICGSHVVLFRICACWRVCTFAASNFLPGVLILLLWVICICVYCSFNQIFIMVWVACIADFWVVLFDFIFLQIVGGFCIPFLFFILFYILCPSG